MNRSNPVYFLAFLVAIVAALGGLALAKGGFYIGKHEGDTLHMVEIIFRIVAGEIPHLDFVTPIGGLAFAPAALFVTMGYGVGTASILAQILMAIVFLPMVWWVGIGRLTPAISAFFGLVVMVLLLALVHGEAERSTAISMHYNRWAWAAAYVAIVTSLVPPVHPRNAVIDGAIVGAMLSALALIKVTYFVAFALPVAIALLLTGQRRALLVSVLTGAMIFAGLTLWLGTGYWLAYLGDLLTVLDLDTRLRGEVVEVEDVAVGLGAVEHAVGAGEGLDQAVVLEVLVHIERVQVFGIEAGEQHVHHDGDVDFLRVRIVGIGPLLVFDAFLHILVVEVELANGVIGAVAGVVVGKDALEGFLLLFRLNGVVGLFLRQVFLNLLHVLVALGRRREHAGNVERLELEIGRLLFRLQLREQAAVFDGVVDGRGGEDGIEASMGGGSIVLGENSLDDGALGDGLAGFRRFRRGFRRDAEISTRDACAPLIVVDVEAEDVPVINGVGDGVGVELLLEEVLCGAHGGLSVHDLLLRGIGLEDGRAGEAKELGQRKEFLNRLVVLTELRAMALIEDEYDACPGGLRAAP